MLLESMNKDIENLMNEKTHFATINKKHEMNEINDWLESSVRPVRRNDNDKRSKSRTTKNLSEMMLGSTFGAS